MVVMRSVFGAQGWWFADDPVLPGLKSKEDLPHAEKVLFLRVVSRRKIMTTWASDIALLTNKILCIIRNVFSAFMKCFFFPSRRIFLCSSYDWGDRTLMVGRTTYKQVLLKLASKTDFLINLSCFSVNRDLLL